MELLDITRLKSEVTVKLEENWAGKNSGETNAEQNKDTIDDRGNFIPEKLKHEVGSDDENNIKPILDNIEQELPDSKCINMYDNMIDIDDVKIDISKTLDNVGSKTAGESNDENNLASTYSNNIDTEGQSKLMTSEHLSGNTGQAAPLCIDGSTFMCLHCKYRTSNKYHYKSHLMIHSTENLLKCSNCNLKCSQKCQMTRHLLRHTDQKLFSCDKCDYKGTQKSNLITHSMTHTGEKPFSCDKCDYRTNHKSHLSRHLFTHTDEKPYACGKCNYKCTQKSSIKDHLLKHIGKKLFSCHKCEYKSYRKDTLNNHLLTHTKPFTCDMCDYKCSHKDTLKKHLLAHTSGKLFCKQRTKTARFKPTNALKPLQRLLPFPADWEDPRNAGKKYPPSSSSIV